MGEETKRGWIKIPAGTKKLFGFGPKIPKYKKFIQKAGSFVPIIFDPSDYKTDNPIEAKRFAYEHAKRQCNFYQDLIDQGVYPTGTKVKIRRIRHENKYFVIMFMPKIKDAFDYAILQPELHPAKDRKYKEQYSEILGNIKTIMKKYDAEVALRGEITKGNNYGIDPKTKKLAYLDYHVGIVPDPNLEKLKRKYLRRPAGGLERLFFGILGIITGIFVLCNNITGNFIGNLNEISSNFIGIILFLLGLIMVFFMRAKK